MSDIILEKIQIGAHLKVTAVDTVSGLEVSVVGPASKAGAQALESLAVKKLETALQRDFSSRS